MSAFRLPAIVVPDDFGNLFACSFAFRLPLARRFYIVMAVRKICFAPS